ncbi:unnamed protein product [Strongylus vulgaris]|uniref:Uncharacterized protein n=1 Tax=Strongylus vulgaris TaxID=40348 RepID=A0A3P7IUR5_STRVU|nr:unnamed protein product [Strongylus vulgaris]
MRTTVYTPTRARAPSRPRLIFAAKRAQLTVASPQAASPRMLSERSSSQTAFYSDQLPIKNEQEVQPDVCNRTESNFEEPTVEHLRAAASLYECISSGTLEMNRAARLLLAQKRNGTFNQSVYDVILPECWVAGHVRTVLKMKQTGTTNFLMAEIQCAKLDRYIRIAEVTQRENDPISKPLLQCKFAPGSGRWKARPF